LSWGGLLSQMTLKQETANGSMDVLQLQLILGKHGKPEILNRKI